MWMDHRAKQEATEINKMGHDVLQSVGGSISLEMQTPKLMWLKRNKPDIWKNVIKRLKLAILPKMLHKKFHLRLWPKI